MSNDPEFTDKLDREVENYIKDAIDGCPDCQELINKMGERTKWGSYVMCKEHHKMCMDITINPKKFIKLK